MSNTEFFKLTINDTDFPDGPHLCFPFQATGVTIAKDDSKHPIEFSFSRPKLDGELIQDDGPISFDNTSEGRLWFRQPDGETVKVRVWLWRGGAGR